MVSSVQCTNFVARMLTGFSEQLHGCSCTHFIAQMLVMSEQFVAGMMLSEQCLARRLVGFADVVE